MKFAQDWAGILLTIPKRDLRTRFQWRGPIEIDLWRAQSDREYQLAIVALSRFDLRSASMAILSLLEHARSIRKGEDADLSDYDDRVVSDEYEFKSKLVEILAKAGIRQFRLEYAPEYNYVVVTPPIERDEIPSVPGDYEVWTTWYSFDAMLEPFLSLEHITTLHIVCNPERLMCPDDSVFIGSLRIMLREYVSHQKAKPAIAIHFHGDEYDAAHWCLTIGENDVLADMDPGQASMFMTFAGPKIDPNPNYFTEISWLEPLAMHRQHFHLLPPTEATLNRILAGDKGILIGKRVPQGDIIPATPAPVSKLEIDPEFLKGPVLRLLIHSTFIKEEENDDT
jgi:hypothetical protein